MGEHHDAHDGDVETIWVRGEGGSIIEMELPLPEPIGERLAKGQIVRVNEDGGLYEPSDDDPELVLESDKDRQEREHLAGLEYARLKHEHPEVDPIDLRDEAAELHGDVIPEDAPGPRPKPAAPKGDWVAYAESMGMDHDEADAMTKVQLLERFGK